MRRFLLIAVFCAGAASLSVEMAASRLLGNYFGSSNIVWATIIGLILIYLSIGYSIGGKWADRSPKPETFYQILSYAGFLIGILPFIARPILQTAGAAFDNLRVGPMVGAFISVLILFCAPVILLGTASPFAIRLTMKNTSMAGATAGKIYTLSTLGSFFGTFLPGLVLIPWIGTYRTFVSIGGFLVLVGLGGLWISIGWQKTLRYLWMPIVLLIISFVCLKGYDKISENIIFEDESAYNYIQVQEKNEYRILRLNEGQGIHSISHPTQENFFGPWEQVLSAPYFYYPDPDTPTIQTAAILGMAGGTSAIQLQNIFPEAHIDGFEIDPAIIDAGKRFFGLRETKKLQVYTQDARWGLSHSDQIYDIISVDAYDPPYIPWHLTTLEFFTDIYDHLSSNGTLVINVARIFEERELLNALFATIDAVFPSTYIVDIPNTFNSVIFATKSPTTKDALIANYILLAEQPSTSEILKSTLEITILNLKDPPEEKGLVLYDDRAPIEWITNKMIANFILSNQLEGMQ